MMYEFNIFTIVCMLLLHISTGSTKKNWTNLQSLSAAQNAPMRDFFIEMDCLGAYNGE